MELRNMSKKSCKIIAVTSDWHVGSTVGLCLPTFQMDDGGEYVPSITQQWLWQKWNLFWDEVLQLKNQLDADVISVINGDVFDGDHHDSSQIITKNPADALKMASLLYRGVADFADMNFVLRGTEAHVGKSGWYEELFAREIKAIKDDQLNTHSWLNLVLDVAGVTISFAHHGKIGTRSWTRVNALQAESVDLLAKYTMLGETPPNLVIRSHVHKYADTYKNFPIRVISTPSWQTKTYYINRFESTDLADIGGLIVICEDGKYDVRERIFNPPVRQPYRIN